MSSFKGFCYEAKDDEDNDDMRLRGYGPIYIYGYVAGFGGIGGLSMTKLRLMWPWWPEYDKTGSSDEEEDEDGGSESDSDSSECPVQL